MRHLGQTVLRLFKLQAIIWSYILLPLLFPGRRTMSWPEAVRTALAEFRVDPIKTTIPLHARLMKHGNFIKSDTDIHFVERWLEQK